MIADRGPYITTYPSKTKYYPFSPRPEEVSLLDVCQHLSHICRFNGACKRFYSVAEHSLLVAELVSPPYKLHALLHDAGEAYTGDVVRPIKHKVAVVHELAEKNQQNVLKAFGLKNVGRKEIQDADFLVLGAELTVLKDSLIEDYDGDYGQQALAAFQASIWGSFLTSKLMVPRAPGEVFRQFKRAYLNYKQEREAAAFASQTVRR